MTQTEWNVRSFVRRMARTQWFVVPAVLLVTYFAYSGLHGARGYLAWGQSTRELAAAEAELAEIKTESGYLQNRVDRMQPDHMEEDLVEELLRSQGYVDRDDVIVLAPENAKP